MILGTEISGRTVGGDDKVKVELNANESGSHETKSWNGGGVSLRNVEICQDDDRAWEEEKPRDCPREEAT